MIAPHCAAPLTMRRIASMSRCEIVICQDSAEFCAKAGGKFVGLARKTIAQRNRFTVALSGGSTPRGLYALLATPEYRSQIAGPQIHLRPDPQR